MKNINTLYIISLIFKTNILLPIVLVFFCNLNCYAQNWLWAKNGKGSSSGGNYVTTDRKGNVIVTGRFTSPTITFGSITLTNTDSSGTTGDMFLVKYDQNGNVKWAKAAGSKSYDSGWSVCTDIKGNVFVSGQYAGTGDTLTFDSIRLVPANGEHAFIAKYDANGNALWAKSTLGLVGYSVSTDISGNVLLTGCWPIFVIKYDTNGNILWSKNTGGGCYDCYDGGYSVGTDIGGNVFVTGFFDSPSITFGSTTLVNAGGGGIGNPDIFLVKYDAAGNVLWAKSAGGNTADGGVSLSVDPFGNVFLTGYFRSPTITFGTTTLTQAGGGKAFIAKYDANGTFLWAKAVGNFSTGYSVSTDGVGNVFLTGGFNGSSITFGSITVSAPTITCGSNCDRTFIVKYDAYGNALCASALSNGSNFLNHVSADPFGNAYVSGLFAASPFTVGADTLIIGGQQYMNFFLAKYQCGENVTTTVNELVNKENVFIFPNPSYGLFTVNLNNQTITSKILVYDVLGNCLLTKLCKNELNKEIDLSKEAKGIYYVEVIGDGERFVKKVAVE